MDWKVAIHNDDHGPDPWKKHGQIGADERLAFLALRTGNGKNFDWGLGLRLADAAPSDS